MNSTDAMSESENPRPFIYISAEDIFRPVVPSAYIDTKREAEEQIDRMVNTKTNYRGVYMRPSESCRAARNVRMMTHFVRPRLPSSPQTIYGCCGRAPRLIVHGSV